MSKPIIGIYKITNKINGKCYIGQSINIKQRWRRHKTTANQVDSREEYNKPLYRAIRKYGIENFNFEIIEECSKEELDEKEIYWIAYYESYDNEKGYNLTKGGNNTGESCKKLTEEQLQGIRQKLLNGQTQTSISKEYNVSQAIISYINAGIEYYHEDWDYPIRNFQPFRGGKFCPDCGKPIRRGSERCSICSGIHRRLEAPMLRDELKELIRNKPFAQILREFNFSRRSLENWCKRYNLPYRKKDIELYSDKEWEII